MFFFLRKWTTTLSPHFSFFHFLVENKEKSALFSLLFFLPWYHTLKALLKRKIWKKLIFIGFSPFRAPFSGLRRRPRHQPPRKLQPPSAGGQKPPVIQAYKGSSHSALSVLKPLKVSHLGNIFSNFPRWNLITSWFFLAVHLKQSLQTDELERAPGARSRKTILAIQFSRRRAEKNFCRSCDLTAFGIKR